eukprot:6905554-Prorocentrum_lima.AAC.1
MAFFFSFSALDVLGVAIDDEAISNDEEAADAEACCGTSLSAGRPGGPVSIRGIAFVSSVVGS